MSATHHNPTLHERLAALRLTMGREGYRGSNDSRSEARVLISYAWEDGVVGSLSISLSEFEALVAASAGIGQ